MKQNTIAKNSTQTSLRRHLNLYTNKEDGLSKLAMKETIIKVYTRYRLTESNYKRWKRLHTEKELHSRAQQSLWKWTDRKSLPSSPSCVKASISEYQFFSTSSQSSVNFPWANTWSAQSRDTAKTHSSLLLSPWVTFILYRKCLSIT